MGAAEGGGSEQCLPLRAGVPPTGALGRPQPPSKHSVASVQECHLQVPWDVLCLHLSSVGTASQSLPNHLPALRRWPSPGYSASPCPKKQSIVPPWLTSRPKSSAGSCNPFSQVAYPDKSSRQACQRIQDAQTLCCESQSCVSTCLHSWDTLTIGHGSFSEI